MSETKVLTGQVLGQLPESVLRKLLAEVFRPRGTKEFDACRCLRANTAACIGASSLGGEVMNSARDPRVDPENGDKVEKSGERYCSLRRVKSNDGHEVTYIEMALDSDHDEWRVVLLTSWRRWAKGAEVISTAEEKR